MGVVVGQDRGGGDLEGIALGGPVAEGDGYRVAPGRQGGSVQTEGVGVIGGGGHNLAVHRPGGAQLVRSPAVGGQLHGALPLAGVGGQLGVVGAGVMQAVGIGGIGAYSLPVSGGNGGVVIEGVVGIAPILTVVRADDALDLRVDHGQEGIGPGHPVGRPGGVFSALELVGGAAFGDNQGLFVHPGHIYNLLNVEQGVAIGAHAVELIPLGVAVVAPAVVVQGDADPVHILVAGVEGVHIHPVGAAEVWGEDHRRPGRLAAGNVYHMPVGGDKVRRLDRVAPDVHLAADSDQHGAAQGVEIGKHLIQLGVVCSVGHLGAGRGFLAEVKVEQESPVPALDGRSVQIGPVLQAIGVVQLIVEGDRRFTVHMALVNQTVPAVRQGAALTGAAVVHAPVGLILRSIVGVVRSRRLGHRIDFCPGVQILVGCVQGGGALIRQGGNGQPQAQRQGQQKGYRFFHPCFSFHFS